MTERQQQNRRTLAVAAVAFTLTCTFLAGWSLADPKPPPPGPEVVETRDVPLRVGPGWHECTFHAHVAGPHQGRIDLMECDPDVPDV